MGSRFECPRCQSVFVRERSADAAFVECPSCGALALPTSDGSEDGGALERAVTASHELPTELSQTDRSLPSEPVARAKTPGVFSGLLGSEVSGGFAEPPSRVIDPSRLDAAPSENDKPTQPPRGAEIDFNFGSDLDVDFPSAPPPMTPSSGTALDRPIRGGAGVHALPADALKALAESAGGDVGTDVKGTPWGSHSGLSDEAFGDLEKAFDEMAHRPASASGVLSADDRRFLNAQGKPPPLPGDGPTARNAGQKRPPPKRRAGQKRPRPQHLQLSPAARELAFLPLQSEPAPAVRARADDGDAAREKAGLPADGGPGRRPRPNTQVPAEETDLVRSSNKRPERRPVPSALQGITFGRVAAMVILALLVGAGGGAALAPKARPANTPRARAELRFADGNRFYDQGRFDDALGAFKGAISIDRTFAPAHRAKGTALAKLGRHDDAAAAYREYLDLEPTAVDANDVRDALALRDGSAKKTE